MDPLLFPQNFQNRWGQVLLRSCAVLELWSLCGLKNIVSFCPSVFQLLWRPSCRELPRASTFPVSIQFQTPLSIPKPLSQQVAANMNCVWSLILVHRALWLVGMEYFGRKYR